MRLVRVIFALFALAAPSLAFAQATILQGGPWAQGRVPMYVGNGFSQPTVQDSGPAGGGGAGVGLSELGITARGNGSTSAPPYVGQGTGPLGTLGCFYDGPTTGAYHYLCFSPNAQGGPLIAAGAGGGAAALPLQCIVNGVSTGCLGSGGATLTNGSTVIAGGATNGLLYDNANVLGVLSSGNNGVLVTSSGGVPSISTTLPNALTIPNPNITGTIGSGLIIPNMFGTGLATFGTQSTWPAASPYNFLLASTIDVVDVRGVGALVTASRTSDNTGAVSPQDVEYGCLIVNDNPSASVASWCQYEQGVKLASLPAAQMLIHEISSDNFGAVAVVDPYTPNPADNLEALRITAGIGVSTSRTNSPVALHIAPNPMAFEEGIVFDHGALDQTAGRLGPAIQMGTNQEIVWFSAAGTKAVEIYETPNSGFAQLNIDVPTNGGIQFRVNGANIVSAGPTAFFPNVDNQTGLGGSGFGWSALFAHAITDQAFSTAGVVENSSAGLFSTAATVSGALGGTGVVNTGKTVTLGGNLTTSGAFATTLTATNTTNSTLPAGTHTLGGLDVAQTWSALQTYSALVNLAPITIATLLAITCNSASEGDVAFVKDTVGSAAATFHLTVAGAGATTVNSLASCNGSTWQYD